MWVLSALLVGLAGSIHCAGMCGPIAIALPGGDETLWNVIADKSLYNFGRIITYGLIGTVAGLAGQGLYLAGIQQWVSILTGCLLILSLILPYSISKRFRSSGIMIRFNSYLKEKLGKLLGQKGMRSLFLIGLLNGFLPCGLVYVALAGAINTGKIINASVYMLLFGLGTFPMMFTISVFGKLIGPAVRRNLSRAIPVFIFILGVLFILRGMNLGIKYISPILRHNTTTEEIRSCQGK